MPTLDSLELVQVFPVSPSTLLARWLDPTWHARFTGGAEASIEAVVGGRYTAWDGYIEGATIELGPARIVQTWRTGDFAEGDADSRLELVVEPAGDGTRLTLRHTGIPAGQGEMYRQGWEDHYFVHMREVLGG